ncbi:MAG: SIMPL domain-containing protein [Hyphomicrobiaceae bacterium]|nr:SIMPL domain-containing protein [Hyphomicrobiaceae bacterium]
MASDELPRTVTVSAAGTVAADPDMAYVQSGVTTEAPSAREALDANSAATRNLIDGLKALGLTAKDIETTTFAVNPVYDYSRDGKPPRLTGYGVTNEVRITVRDLPRLGELLDKMVSLGANQMRGLSFEVSTAETLRDEARRAAIANARRRADLYAEATGAKVGQVVTISEETAHVPFAPKAAMARSAAAEAVPIEAGQAQLEARVTVTWELN